MPNLTPSELFELAHSRGLNAASSVTPEPMYVQDGSRVFEVTSGPCGFAGVRITPARGKLVSWLKANQIGYKAYQGGWYVSCHEFGQSMQLKEVYAREMAVTFQEHGVKAHMESRMD